MHADINKDSELNGVGPIDNRTSTKKLHHIAHMWNVTCDMWHVTPDMWHVTPDMWHMTCVEGDRFLKISSPSLLHLVIYDVLNIF